MRETPVVDLLNQFRFADYSERPPRIDRWLRRPETFTAADAAVYQGSGIDVFALGDAAPGFNEGLRFFAEWNGLPAAHPGSLPRIGATPDIGRAHQDRKTGVMPTMQDSTHFRAPGDVDTFFGLGQRISQLTYNFNNRIGSGFLEQRDGGLSVFGLGIMKRMEESGHGGGRVPLRRPDHSRCAGSRRQAGDLHPCQLPRDYARSPCAKRPDWIGWLCARRPACRAAQRRLHPDGAAEHFSWGIPNGMAYGAIG